jgi:Xaa-Pro aminopeptidase
MAHASDAIATPFSDERKKAYFNPAGKDKPLKSPIPHAVLERARTYRKARMVEYVNRYNCDAILLYDPLNTRYVFDSPNMQLWATHNPFRYALVFADGHAIDFQYHGAEFLNDGNRQINETRTATTWFYMASGGRTEERVNKWADELVSTLRERCGGKSKLRIAVDKVEHEGAFALTERGVELINGQELTELARSIKSADELELMKWTVRVCEAGMARIWENSLPGKTEQEIWAELHYENIRSGGEWIETRLLAVGQHTNPWFAEASDIVAEKGDIIAFDTDLIGPYGYCADISRTWTIGHTPFSNSQRELYKHAIEQIEHNSAILKAGITMAEFNEKSWKIPEKYVDRRYSVALHGVGLCDEWPSVPLHPDFAGAYEMTFEKDMVICVESLIGEVGGKECVKLETQVVITENGIERQDSFPWEDV